MAARNRWIVGADHAGLALKRHLVEVLQKIGDEVEDLGTHSEDSVDYPDYAAEVARKVAAGEGRGLLVCGTGIGMAMTANKVPGVRAAVAWTVEVARLARQHNDANVLAIGARTTPLEDIPKIVRTFFSTAFEGGRHASRVEKIGDIEKRQ